MPTVSTNRTRLHYEIHGVGDPLLLIHGLGSSTRDWEFQIPEFSRFYQVIAVDLRGHGLSEKPPGPYSIPMLAADVLGLLRILETNAAHVLGISLGGAVAMQLAIDSPRAVRSLTIVNSSPEFIARTIRQRIMIWERLVVSRLLGMRRLGELLTRRLFTKPEHAHLRRTFAARFAENDKRSYLTALHALIGWSAVPRLHSIQCPTLIVGGDHDYLPLSKKEEHTRMIPGARLVILKDSGHALPAEKPAEFNRTVLDFLAGHS
jgi:pimeloyl-ACP methyl ester carboxylesterase